MIEIIEKQIKDIPVLEVLKADKRNEALPLVIFYNGWTGCKEKVLTEAYELAKRDLRVVLPDAKFHGDRRVGSVEKHRLQFWEIVVNSVKEFPVLVDEYQKTTGILAGKIGVTGLSMGAITTCALMTVYDWITAGVSLMGTPCPVDFARQLITQVVGDDELPHELIEQQLSQLAVLDLSKNPQKIAGRPMHFWHGTADEMVPYVDDRAFFESIKGNDYAKNVTFTTAEGQGHKVSYAAAVEMAKKFATYFSTNK